MQGLNRSMKLYEWSYQAVLALDFGSLGVAAAGVIVGAANMNMIVLSVVSGASLIVNGCSKLVDLKDRESSLQYACKIHSELLIRIKSYLRGITYSQEVLVSDMALIDEMIARNTQHVKQKYKNRYDSICVDVYEERETASHPETNRELLPINE